MRKLYVLALAAAFMLIGAQAFASPPVAPPPEGFLITTETTINCEGTVKETESYNWTYFEGYSSAGAIGHNYNTAGAPVPPYYVGNGMGWQEGAQIAYYQKYTGSNGTTTFHKEFEANSAYPPDQGNLVVSKLIGYTADPNSNAAVAEHTEKVGLSVVSMGGNQGLNFAGLLSLCPWVSTGGSYPATNEGIAAGSYFKVTDISNFSTSSKVTSTDIPKLNYIVDASTPAAGMQNKGYIEAKFVVELWEGQGTWAAGSTAANPPPAVQSRTSYSETASADGVWTFKKSMGYEATFPAFTQINPFGGMVFP